jgi:recombination protein RecT
MKNQKENPEKKQVAANPETTVAKKEPSQSERFTQEVMKQFTNTAGEVVLTNFQKKLIQNYFIKIDQTLKDLEKKRMAKTEQYRDALAFSWPNVNLQKLAVDVVSFSSVGLDPVQSNHISCIPYKNTSTNKFDIGFIPGYRGMELKARKYGLDIPDDVIVELVYRNDKFKQIKRDLNNKVESYTFEVVNDFDRGELVGGFYYHKFFNAPEKNRLRVFSREEIEKRKPAYASPEFWGGEKDKWDNGKKVGKETIEGWFDEMAYKTVYRAAYNAITIDSQKIDDHYVAVLEKEKELGDARVFNEIKTNANKGEAIGFSHEEESQQQLAKSNEPVIDVTHTEEKEEPVSEESENKGPGF